MVVTVVVTSDRSNKKPYHKALMADLLTLSDCRMHTFVQERLW